MFEQSVPTQVWQRAKQSPTQFNSNKNKPKIDYKEVAWVPPVENPNEACGCSPFGHKPNCPDSGVEVSIVDTPTA